MVKEPERIARLEHDRRGYPIPWNVLRGTDGAPIYTINDDRRHWQALEEQRCPICGERLGRWRVWIGGPRSAFDPCGWYMDLPTHQDCGRYALQVCPYLAAPRYEGRIDVPDPSKIPPEAKILIDHTMIPERPPLFVAVTGDYCEVQDNGIALPYTRPVKPVAAYEFWHHGQQIPKHRAMPILRGIFGADWEMPVCREEI